MANQAKLWDRLAERYVDSPIADPVAYENKLNLTRPYLTDTMDVLELGCGSGGTARLHAPLVKSYRAVDLSAKMLDFARAQGPVPDNLSFEQGDIATLQLAPESYDAIFTLSLLHLLKDPDGAIRKIHTALKPGGLFVSSTACLSGNPIFRFIAITGQTMQVLPHLNFFKPDMLRAMIRSAGFELVEDWQPAKNKALFLIARKKAG
ncbi:MAG: class I SAM-dependent methyltransferase [Maritimibacter sp.]